MYIDNSVGLIKLISDKMEFNKIDIEKQEHIFQVNY